MSRTAIRLVLFDAFDTLITPRLPIHVQYAQEAHKHGLPESSITPASVRAAFKPAFRKTTERFPQWGRHAQPKPMSPSEWWMVCIEETMRLAGAEQGKLDQVMPRLGKALLDRFESAEGYRAFADVIPCCESANGRYGDPYEAHELAYKRPVTYLQQAGVKTGLVSNADDRILKTLGALGITPLLTHGTTISQVAGYEKPDPRIFQTACRSAGIERCEEGVLMVGDEVEADYHGALRAGLEARLIRRPGEFSDGAKRRSEDEEREMLHRDGVCVIRSLEEVVDEVRERNRQS
ncbi:hypothetical protein QFC19_009263 [Naganishia cerealis]|uniref:Uncharacterized protein n=1 Tax=Naganishia cerealis TaxID=610337 RepID=A0ACC2UVJ9_9TREE|nr:hypothetical protein QFC19_009263 [Naganishia cerealis]